MIFANDKNTICIESLLLTIVIWSSIWELISIALQDCKTQTKFTIYLFLLTLCLLVVQMQQQINWCSLL